MKMHYHHYITIFIYLFTVDQGGLAGVAKNPNKGSPLGELRCYECGTLTDGERCQNLDYNHSKTLQCPANHPFCMTKRFSYSLNAPVIHLWYMERNCSQHCEDYCITMGERVKIFACTSCCSEDLCNTGNGQPSSLEGENTFYAVILALYTVSSKLLGF